MAMSPSAQHQFAQSIIAKLHSLADDIEAARVAVLSVEETVVSGSTQHGYAVRYVPTAIDQPVTS